MSNELPEIAKLRTSVKARPRLDLEIKARISQVLKSYDVDVNDQVLANLILALPEEIGSGLGVVLPEPDIQ